MPIWEMLFVCRHLTMGDLLDIATELAYAEAEFEGCPLLPEETDYCMN